MTIIRDELNRPQFVVFTYKYSGHIVYRVLDLEGNLLARHVINY
jgi:hypothetical protein